MPRFVLDATHAGVRLDRVLAQLMPDTSRATIQRWIAEGRVSVGGRGCRGKELTRAGDVVEVEPGPSPVSAAQPDPNITLSVVFEDEHLLVVNKPAGLVVHPARGHRQGTLVNALLARPGFARAADPADPEGAVRPGIVHRLDKDTSGLLVVAKDDVTREGLKEQLSSHSVERAYVGLTLGVPKNGTVSTLHGRNPRSRLRFSSRVSTGKSAVTHVRVEEVLARGRAARIECRLETGRTHQIRVHLAEQCATPLLADALYGNRSKDAELARIADALGRQALHARVLGFVHPVTGQRHRFEAPWPADLAQALDALRRLTA